MMSKRPSYLELEVLDDLKAILSFSKEKVQIAGPHYNLVLAPVKTFKINPSFFKKVFVCPLKGKLQKKCLSTCGCCIYNDGTVLIGLKKIPKRENIRFLTFKINKKPRKIPVAIGKCPFFFRRGCKFGGSFEKFHKNTPIICHLDPGWLFKREKGVLKISRKKCNFARKVIPYTKTVSDCDIFVLKKIAKFYKKIGINSDFLQEIINYLKD